MSLIALTTLLMEFDALSAGGVRHFAQCNQATAYLLVERGRGGPTRVARTTESVNSRLRSTMSCTKRLASKPPLSGCTATSAAHRARRSTFVG